MNADVIGALTILALVALGYVVHRIDRQPLTPGGMMQGLVMLVSERLACWIYCGVRGDVDWRCRRCIQHHTRHDADVLDPGLPGVRGHGSDPRDRPHLAAVMTCRHGRPLVKRCWRCEVAAAQAWDAATSTPRQEGSTA